VTVIVVPDCVHVAEVDALLAAGILTLTPRIRKALLGIELNCSESKRKCVYAQFGYVCVSSTISPRLVQTNES